MVKGISRQVVLVRPPDTGLFEQAIFFVRGDRLQSGEITDEMLRRQAEAAARQYARRPKPQSPAFAVLLGALLGGGAVGLLWLLFSIL